MNAAAFWAFFALIVWPALAVLLGLHLSRYVLVIWQVYAGLPLDDDGERLLRIVNMVCERIYKSPTRSVRVCMHCGAVTRSGLYQRRFTPVECSECGFRLAWSTTDDEVEWIMAYLEKRDALFDSDSMGDFPKTPQQYRPDPLLHDLLEAFPLAEDDPDFQEMQRQLAIVEEQNALCQADDPAFDLDVFNRAMKDHRAAFERFNAATLRRARAVGDAEATEVAEIIDEMRAKLDAPRPRSGIIDAEFGDDEPEPEPPEPPRL